MAEHPGRKVFILDSLSTGPELELIIEKYKEQNASIKIGVNHGLCSYYAEKGGILVGFESGIIDI